ncbi:hypothetical protein G6M04_11575 [Agrobacterium rhizogenes]|uniref:hypothetical protein n=1 Tax=Rhizobium rhizogenes TaxID=359 RepID=UPI001571F206|nr:hypothetical protein [Rhizobium rhizogenes]NTG48022.1 hypothetical protein [Rhizobium rhizogenes]
MLRVFIAFLLATSTVMSVAAPGQAAEDHAQASRSTVPFTVVRNSAYQSFVKNWDEKKQPVLCGSIRSASEWEKIFNPAATMQNKKPFSPAASFYARKQLLVVARVVSAPSEGEQGKIFTATAVSVKNGALQLNYDYRAPQPGGSYQIKDYLLVSIPKNAHPAGPVTFIENGKVVCDLSPKTSD